MSCEHKDCFSCPYPDCIATHKEVDKHQVISARKKSGRKPISPDLKYQHRLEYQRRYYYEHQDRMQAINRQYYRDHKKEVYAQRQAKREAEWLEAGVQKEYTIWITNGKENKRTTFSELASYEELGWWRGRTVNRSK